MKKRDKLDPNSPGYTNALLEDIDDKFQAIVEATVSIPQIQKDIKSLKKQHHDAALRLDSWEENIN